jgi:lipopolysaccharide transport protein LptA/LPS export ABC transporter protein LptC
MNAITKRRQRKITIIKYAFVIVVIITMIFALYFVFNNQTGKVSKKSIDSNNEQPLLDFKVIAPRLESLNIEHGPYHIKAKEMQESLGNISFVTPEVKIMLKQLDIISIKSNRAKLNTNNNRLELIDEIIADFNQEYFFYSDNIEILEKNNVLKSSYYAKITNANYNLESQNGFIVNYNQQHAILYGPIKLNVKNIKNNNNIDISAKNLEVFWYNATGIFYDDVTLTNNQTIVKANKMKALFNIKSKELERIYAYGEVQIINKEQTATSDYGEYIVKTGILTLKDNVHLSRLGNVMVGDLLNYNFYTEKAELIGSSDPTLPKKQVRAVITP